MADFTELPDQKVGNRYPVTDPTRQVDYTEINKVFTACTELQDYLTAGVFDKSSTVALPAVTMTAATASALNLVADQSPSVGPEMDYVGYNGNWFIGVDVANSPTSRDYVLTGVRGSYSFTDGATTNGSTTLTSASGGGFVSALVGASISGAGIPAGTTVAAVGGPSSLTMSASAIATATGVRVTVTRNTVQDLLYWKHRGGLSPTLGIGVTPPDGGARVQISPQDDEPAMGTLRLRVGPSQAGNALTVHDSTPNDRVWVTKDFYLSGNHPLGAAVIVQADVTNARALCITDNSKANLYGFTFPGGNTTAFRCISGGNDSFIVGTNGSLRHVSSTLGFFSAAAAAKPNVTGSRGGNAALASLLTALATLGLITDSTTA